jgi:ribosomal protein S18 acetylase RimI-like enzyme
MDEKENTTLDIRIEPVKLSELAELADVAARTFSDAFGADMDPEDLAQTLAENRSVAYFKATMKSSHVLVAKHDDKIVGYVQYGEVKIPEIHAAESDKELGRLYVETSLQGRKVGKQLMEAALNDSEMASASNIYLQVWDENKRALAMYESYGFKQCGVTHFELAGKPAQDIVMIKRQS